jgi:hypothetical protein
MQAFKRIAAFAALAMVAAVASVKSFAVSVAHKAHDATFGYMANNGMVMGLVLLGRPYSGYAAATIVKLPTNVEAALVAQGLATVSAGPVTPGAVTTTQTEGRVGIAAGSSSVVVTNPNVDANSVIHAMVNQAAADGTLLRVERIVPAAGSFTIYGTANATAQTNIDWRLMPASGDTVPVNS